MKRQRPDSDTKTEQKPPPQVVEPATDDNKSGNNDVYCTENLLTPHTVRLLKLIQEGSRDHASMAALQLTQITAQSSPLVLWDVLGRLQQFLVHPNWQTRHNASTAMQGVAKHLPPTSRRNFLEHVLEEQKEGYLWLTLENIQKEITVILEKGRLLWAYSESDEDVQEEQYLRHFDERQLMASRKGTYQTESESDFVRRRIQWQRRVLAQRVGLSGLMQATGSATHGCLADTITSEDLLLPPTIASNTKLQSETKKKKKQPKKRKRSKQNTEKEEDDAPNYTMRALLVMEMKREQDSSESAALSHDNPQSLLATELLYRVFDPSWYVRHGALMGMLALLRAWHNRTSTTAKEVFGAWPQDILARCICVLVLDRFGDYSGTTVATQESASGGVVAPVRETAGQLLAMVWYFAPSSVQEDTLKLLCQLAKMSDTDNGGVQGGIEKEETKNDWEIRHGALLALKYIAVVSTSSKSSSQVLDNLSFLPALSDVARNSLSDESDDVQSVAAQTLTVLVSSSRLQQQHIAQEIFVPLWQALQRTRMVSSSILDLMSLCSAILKHSAGSSPNSAFNLQSNMPMDKSRILDSFRGFLDHDLMSVRTATLQSIASIVEPVWKSCLAATTCTGRLDLNLLASFDQLLGRLFDIFFFDPASNTNTLPGENPSKSKANKKMSGELSESPFDPEAAQDFYSHRDSAWCRLLDILHQARLQGNDGEAWFQNSTRSLILRYFGVLISSNGAILGRLYQPDSGNFDLFPSHRRAAKALARLFRPDQFQKESHSSEEQTVRLGRNEKHHSLLERTIQCFLESPWRTQCEASCLLLCALADRTKMGTGDSTETYHDNLRQILVPCRQSTVVIIQRDAGVAAPLCLALECHEKGEKLRNDSSFMQICDSSFVSGCVLSEGTASVASVIEFWKRAAQSKGADKEILDISTQEVSTTVAAMRFYTTLVGSSIAAADGALPTQKVTPIVRPLMTSLKNEPDVNRLDHACEAMVALLSSSLASHSQEENSGPTALTKAREKLLNNMCEVLAGTVVDNSEYKAFESVIQSIVEIMSRYFDTMKCVQPVWRRLEVLLDLTDDSEADDEDATQQVKALNLLRVVCGKLVSHRNLTKHVSSTFLPPLVFLACRNKNEVVRVQSCSIVRSLCRVHPNTSLLALMPNIATHLDDRSNDSYRLASCKLLHDIVGVVGLSICPFVRQLLRRVMSLMADPISSISKMANSIFASLVRVAPLVRPETSVAWDTQTTPNSIKVHNADSVMDHLIHGKPLPAYSLPGTVKEALAKNNISLRPYQMEGIAWLRFLQTVNLNGALCDSMGLGKTLQALIGVAISHCESLGESTMQKKPKSLVVCPSSVVGHWMAEIEKFFPEKSFFRSLAYMGSGEERKLRWKQDFAASNIIVTSYACLRTDAIILSKPMWRFCILDEGHLLKNPKTATARASRRLRAQHKLILTGTPVQNKVQEIFATFDFLMPNFLGDSSSFSKEFARPITKGHLTGASAESINEGLEKLKVLHQQVLPFILRREKSQVLKELPPKCITNIPCEMSNLQRTLYKDFCASEEAKRSVAALQAALQQSYPAGANETKQCSLHIGSEALKILLFLRLLCTHPALVERRAEVSLNSRQVAAHTYDIDISGKFLALADLLRTCGIHKDEITGADNDTSLLYCDQEEDDKDDTNDQISSLLHSSNGGDARYHNDDEIGNGDSKCLLFAQFTQSLDVVEEFLLKRYMPSLRYLRLDGQVPANKRGALVDAFNTDPSIKLMLLTTKVGGLGLNLTGADTVIFLESDYNPFADLQAADRAHRIGQDRTVNVYRLITKDSIEEKIMNLQEKKIAISNAIVNTDNSTLFSMGTDRLLDIFTCRSSSHTQTDEKKKEQGSGVCDLDALVERYGDDYGSLSVNDFVKALQQE